MKLIDFWREESVRFDAILFDIDGTLVYGPQPIPGAAEFLALLRRDGTPFFFLTNDGDHTRRQKSGFLNRAGIEAAESEVISPSCRNWPGAGAGTAAHCFRSAGSATPED